MLSFSLKVFLEQQEKARHLTFDMALGARFERIFVFFVIFSMKKNHDIDSILLMRI